ncbi:DUF3618 domain-containing protein [Gordonia insulae]|uniref:DUF3618 domain-containing protein n=1 Tax=Gordonia insulae TaxID=2420509 RepID=A0A3G8JVG9_9ACTN|nr:DUF3618 domain-containing protein [Gordonia insulae]AZG48599.1 hypothetical protein D7316_05217 [Gordonia insulae]
MTGPDVPGEIDDPAVTDDLPPVQQQREELAQTVDALSRKLDVPARLKETAADTAHTAQVKARENRRSLLVTAAVAGAAVVGLIIVKRRRTS